MNGRANLSKMRVPIIGDGDPRKQVQAKIQAEAQAQAMSQQMFLNMYLPLVVQLGQFRVAHGYEAEGGLTEVSTPDRVADEAWCYADAAMKRLGAEKPEST